ncbi:MAG TPA: hypothetical protein VH560_10045 [Polyangia bacterium]|jgi:hypothetical protein|nr:hypothetical protein [Polyangia bacterium]
MKIISAVALAAICLIGAVGAHAADAGAPKAAAATAPAGAKKIDWEHMSEADKKKYMKATVLPEMKKAFQAYDAKAYKKFTCGTCHGDGATDGKFKMPNAKLPKLPAPTNREGFMALHAKKPEAVKFMGEVVKPKMAELLGLAEWSPTNMTGFGCYQCHTAEK